MLTLLFFSFSPLVDSLLIKAVECSYVEDFIRAESLITFAKRQEKENPAPYFLLASLYEMMWVDLGEPSLETKIFTYADSTITKAKKWVKKNPLDPWGYFFIGGSYTLKVFYYVMKEDYLGSIFLLNPGVYYLEKAKEIDSTLYDVYLGLGGWEYIKGKFPLVKENKEKALTMIEKAISKGKFVSHYSIVAYANICIREKDYDQAILMLKPLLDSYPSSRTFNWPFLKALYGKKDYERALKVAEKLIEISSYNNFSKFEAYYYKIKILLELGELEEAKTNVEIALNINVLEEMLNVKERKKELKQIKRKLEKELKRA
ncbi:MAG: hypothetical protein ABIN61_07295 [candidate division WOR-3 bacterium]